MKAIDPLLLEYLPIEVMHLLDGGIGHPGRPILTPESCPQRFKLLLFCRVIKAHIPYMVPPYSENWLAANLRNGWRAAAAGLRTGRKKAHSDTAVGMEVCKNVDAGGRGMIFG